MASKHYRDTDMVRTMQDEIKRVIDLKDFNLTLPSVDIFDEPTRCYTVNLEWAKIITGAIDLLTEVAVWKDAKNEGYIGIRKILEYLRGDNCEMFDCDDVEDCLETSLIIDAINTLIQTNITDIANLDTRVTSNETTLATHTTDIAQNAADIALQAVLIQDNFNEISSNNTELADHETRITILENAPGGGGSGQILSARIETLIFDYTVTTPEQTIPLVIPSEYSGLRIEWLVGYDSGQGLSAIYINSDFVANNYQWSNITGGTNVDARVGIATTSSGAGLGSFAMTNVTFNNLDKAVVRTYLSRYGRRSSFASNSITNGHYVQWEKTDTITQLNFEMVTGNLATGTNVRVWGIRDTDILVPSIILNDPIVTFDTGGSPYNLPSGQVGIISSGGNPLDCLFAQSLAMGEYLEVEVDLGEVKTIDSAWFERYVEEGVNVSWEILVDDIVKLSFTGTYAVGSWGQVGGGISATTGQIIRLRFVADVANQGLRIDNFKVFTT